MKLSFNQKRVGIGILLLIALLCIANHQLGWGAVGPYSKQVMISVFVLMFIYIYRGGLTLEEVQEYRKRRDREVHGAPRSRPWLYFPALLIIMLAFAFTGPLGGLLKGEPVQREQWIELVLGEVLVLVAGVLGWRYFRRLRSLEGDRK